MDRQYRKQRQLKLHRGIPTSLVPADKAVQHLARMLALGWSLNALEQMAAVPITSEGLRLVATGRHATITRQTAAAIMSIPHTLAPGPGVDDQTLVPVTGARRRVHALMRLQWPHSELRAKGIESSHLARGTYTQMAARKWRAVAAVYEELCMTIGPSEASGTRARRAGHPAPLAWGEQIDDPNAQPAGLKRTNAIGIDDVVVRELLALRTVPSTREEKEEAMRRWVAAGNSARSLALAHGWNDGRYGPRKDGAA
jgi:hypothetical protein